MLDDNFYTRKEKRAKKRTNSEILRENESRRIDFCSKISDSIKDKNIVFLEHVFKDAARSINDHIKIKILEELKKLGYIKFVGADSIYSILKNKDDKWLTLSEPKIIYVKENLTANEIDKDLLLELFCANGEDDEIGVFELIESSVCDFIEDADYPPYIDAIEFELCYEKIQSAFKHKLLKCKFDFEMNENKYREYKPKTRKYTKITKGMRLYFKNGMNNVQIKRIIDKF
jgi:hypothetical protein